MLSFAGSGDFSSIAADCACLFILTAVSVIKGFISILIRSCFFFYFQVDLFQFKVKFEIEMLVVNLVLC